MMPSRGLRLVRGNVPQLLRVQSRNLSSGIRAIRIANTRSSLSASSLPRWSAPKSTPSLTASLRFASTTSASSPAQATSVVSPAEANPSADISGITLDDLDLGSLSDISQISEKIGYLQEIGINFGWGPTGIIEWVLEHIHIYSGLPWWGSLACTAIILRMITVPLYLRASDSNARQQALASITKPITDKMKEAQKEGNQQLAMQYMSEYWAIRKRAGVKFTDALLPAVFQGVIGFCGYRLIYKMTHLPVPGFKDGGFLWLTDLTVPDPYALVPLAMAGTLHLLVRLGGESGAQANDVMTPAMKNLMLYGLPGFIFFIMAWQPGALCLWFATTGFIGVAQALLLQRPAVRQALNLAPLYKAPKEEQDKGPLAAIGSMMKPAGEPSSKNTVYMAPQWQAPNLKTRSIAHESEGKVIDVSQSSKSDTPPTWENTAVPGEGDRSVSSTAANLWSRIRGRKDNAAQPGQLEAERAAQIAAAEARQAAKKKREAKKKAEEYERRFTKEGRR